MLVAAELNLMSFAESALQLTVTRAATPRMTRRAAITAATAVGNTAWTRSRPSWWQHRMQAEPGRHAGSGTLSLRSHHKLTAPSTAFSSVHPSSATPPYHYMSSSEPVYKCGPTFFMIGLGGTRAFCSTKATTCMTLKAASENPVSSGALPGPRR